MICGCGKPVEEVRVEFGYKICAACAHSGKDVPRPKGRMVYSHKTGGEIEILSEESWNENKKYFTPNGARSALKNFSRNICS
jgi:hypothetical protein|tara:strand:+ start:385 stop:630 length:246 start_codon:yes stop_codon:yes gene_type:complete